METAKGYLLAIARNLRWTGRGGGAQTVPVEEYHVVGRATAEDDVALRRALAGLGEAMRSHCC